MEKRVPKGRKMWTVQIDENGGVHIPKEALALIGLKAGESAAPAPATSEKEALNHD